MYHANWTGTTHQSNIKVSPRPTCRSIQASIRYFPKLHEIFQQIMHTECVREEQDGYVTNHLPRPLLRKELGLAREYNGRTDTHREYEHPLTLRQYIRKYFIDDDEL